MPTCRKCKKSFPNRMIIDGKSRNLYKRTFCVSCSPFGQGNRKSLDHYGHGTKLCNACKQQVSIDQFYCGSDGRLFSRCIQCESTRKHNAVINFKLLCMQYLDTDKCELCGYDQCLAAIDFHHIDPKGKDFPLGKYHYRYELTDAIQLELDKCMVVCSNCHREIHYKRA